MLKYFTDLNFDLSRLRVIYTVATEQRAWAAILSHNSSCLSVLGWERPIAHRRSQCEGGHLHIDNGVGLKFCRRDSDFERGNAAGNEITG